MMLRTLLFTGLLFSLSMTSFAAFREWTNTEGQSFSGEFVEQKDDRVLIRREADLKAFWVGISDLCAADQAYLQEREAKANEVNNIRMEITALNRTDETSGWHWEGRYLTPINHPDLPPWFRDRAGWRYYEYWHGYNTKTTGRLLRIEATSIEGDVDCLFQIMFFEQGGRLFDRHVVIAKVEFQKGTLAVASAQVHNYYGWAVVARRLSDGKILAIDGFPRQCIDLAKPYL